MNAAAPNANQALWEKGDFTRIAQCMRESGEALIESIGIGPGSYVLDLGCGDGTTALPAARRGAHVLGVDIARNLVDAGNRRAKEAGLANTLRFTQGDACDLSNIENKSFDWVVSIFGAMFAPKPLDVAREMVRVTRRGGHIVMGNWIPNDPTFVAQMFKISTAYSPPPPEGFVSPLLWGVEENVAERFGAAGVAREHISCVPDTYTFHFDGTPAEYIDLFRRYFGPAINAFDAAAKNGKEEELRRELEAVCVAHNQSTDPRRTIVVGKFLRVTVAVH